MELLVSNENSCAICKNVKVIFYCTLNIKMQNILCTTGSQLVVCVLGGGGDGAWLRGCFVFIVFKG